MTANSRSHNGPPDSDRQLAASRALIGLAKLFKAVRFYPAGHPALKSTCSETRQLFSPLLESGNLVVAVRKTGFSLDEEPVDSDLPVLKELAFVFFARLVKRLLFLPELSAHDLEVFARCASDEPNVIQRAGGLQEMLLKAHVTALFVNQIDLKTVMSHRERILTEQGIDPAERDIEVLEPPLVEQPEQELAQPLTPEQFLETLQNGRYDPAELLRQLKIEQPDRHYRLLCEKLAEILPEHLHEPDLATPRRALLLLAAHGADKQRRNAQRRACLEALNRLGSPSVLKFFIDALCDKHRHGVGSDDLMETLNVFQAKAASALLQRLMIEDHSQARKILADALVRLGNSAVPLLVERLADERWFIVRNVIVILGRIQNRKTAMHIRPYLDHRDHRVRREAVRALGRIGGPVALRGLQQVIDSRDRELCPLALVALGVMQDAAAVDPLLKIVQTRDPLLKQLELKTGAIKALGAIGSPQAIPWLTKTLLRRRLWKGNLYDKLRTCAAQALGRIASEEALPSLQIASNDRSPLVAHAAKEALEKIDARSNHVC